MNAVLREPTKHLLSRDDYYRMAEVGILAPDARVELINGEIIDMVPIGKSHAGTVDRLNRLLVQEVGTDAIVRVQGPVSLGNYSEPEPDLAVLRPRDDFYTTGDTHPTAEDVYLLIEVAISTKHYDRNIKIPLYANHGIPAVVIILPSENEIWSFADPANGEYRQSIQLTDFSRVPVGNLDNHEMDLAWLK